MSLSLRYVRLTFVLVLVALVPTVVNSYLGTTDEGPVLSQAVPTSVEGFTSVPTNRRDASIRRSFDASDWVERRYSKAGEEITLLVARSFDMKRLYHHPELAIADGAEYKPARLETVASPSGAIDVHVLEGEQNGLIAYVLLYRGETVARPLVFQIMVAPDLLLRGRRPMTLAIARDQRHRPGQNVLRQGGPISLLQAVVGAVRQGGQATAQNSNAPTSALAP